MTTPTAAPSPGHRLTFWDVKATTFTSLALACADAGLHHSLIPKAPSVIDALGRAVRALPPDYTHLVRAQGIYTIFLVEAPANPWGSPPIIRPMATVGAVVRGDATSTIRRCYHENTTEARDLVLKVVEMARANVEVLTAGHVGAWLRDVAASGSVMGTRIRGKGVKSRGSQVYWVPKAGRPTWDQVMRVVEAINGRVHLVTPASVENTVEVLSALRAEVEALVADVELAVFGDSTQGIEPLALKSHQIEARSSKLLAQSDKLKAYSDLLGTAMGPLEGALEGAEFALHGLRMAS